MTSGVLDQTSIVELIALRPGVYRGDTPDGRSYLLAAGASQYLGDGGRLRPVLAALAGDPMPSRQVCQLLQEAVGEGAGPRAGAELLARLVAGGWLTTTVSVGGHACYTLVPHRDAVVAPAPEQPSPELVMSRFAIIRKASAGLIVESPLSWCDFQLHHPALLAVLGLDRIGPTAPPGLSAELYHRLVCDLRWAGVAVPPDEAEDAELRVRQWSAHELWFHKRSRGGAIGSGTNFGGTYWGARERHRPLPAQRPPFPGDSVLLNRPDLVRVRASDPPLTSVIEGRVSLREHDDSEPLTVEQLGEFLYRCARNRSWSAYAGLEQVSRPYPSGGSGYELELYPVVRHVSGLPAGMYHYDPQEHRLEPVCGPGPSVARLLAAAAKATEARAPQLLLVVAARFGRVMWKYEAMPYSLILKHVGVLFHQMYLVATAMRLAPCALGAGDLAAFTTATKTDPLTEASVGEFMLGSRMPATPAEPA